MSLPSVCVASIALRLADGNLPFSSSAVFCFTQTPGEELRSMEVFDFKWQDWQSRYVALRTDLLRFCYSRERISNQAVGATARDGCRVRSSRMSSRTAPTDPLAVAIMAAARLEHTSIGTRNLRCQTRSSRVPMKVIARLLDLPVDGNLVLRTSYINSWAVVYAPIRTRLYLPT